MSREIPADFRLQYIATGTGRCGSAFVARYLSSGGSPCGHELLCRIGGCRQWGNSVGALERVEGESSCAFLFHKDHTMFYDATLIHLVRHPLAFIRSLIGEDERTPGRIVRAAVQWIRWNRDIENTAANWSNKSYLHRIEDDPAVLFEIIGHTPKADARLFDDRTYNAHVKTSVSVLWWSEVEAADEDAAYALREAAQHYGYKE